MFTIRPSRQEMYADDPNFLWKYILRSLAIILALISAGLIGWSLTHPVIFPSTTYAYNDYYYYYYWPYDNDIIFLPWEFIPLGLSILWNTANILVLLLRNRPIHPGANVACDLLLWLGFIVTGTFVTLGADTYFGWNSSNDALYRKGVVIAVGAALGLVVLLMHFALFISACRYTNARRVGAKATVLAERMYNEKVSRDGDAAAVEEERRNPNAAFVPICEPLERQAPLDYGMPPAPTRMTVGERKKRRPEERGRGTRHSNEQPEVVVTGSSGGHAVMAQGEDV